MDSETSSAIRAFLHSFSLVNESFELHHLSDGLILADLLEVVKGFRLESQKISRRVDNWTIALSNIKTLSRCLADYYETVLRRPMPHPDFEPVEVSKHQNSQHLLRLFTAVICALTQSENKQIFIQKIMRLPTEHQATLAQIIQRGMMKLISIDQRYHYRRLAESLDILQNQNTILAQQLRINFEENTRLNERIKELEVKLDTALQNQSAEESSKGAQETSILMDHPVGSTIQYSQEKILLDNLKEKMLLMTAEHEKQLSRMREEIVMLEDKLCRVPQLQSLADMYRENYQEALEHLGKISVWQQEKMKMSQQIGEQAQQLTQKTQQATDLSQKVTRLQQQLLDTQMEKQKLRVRYEQLEIQVKKTLHLQPPRQRPNRVGRHTLTQLCPLISEDSDKFKLQECQRQCQRRNKKIKQLEKEVARQKGKADKVFQLQRQKVKLENIIVDMNRCRSDEIAILTTSLYQLRMRYGMLVEQFSCNSPSRSKKNRQVARSKTYFKGAEQIHEQTVN